MTLSLVEEPEEESSLDRSEQVTLSGCEVVLERGLRTFIEMGGALATIRDGRLYRDTHHTFEAYCKERWEMTHRHVNHLIKAVEVAQSLGTMVPTPTSERQARELARVPEDQRVEVWRRTLEKTEGKPTAAAVYDVRTEYARTQPFPMARSATEIVAEEGSMTPYELPCGMGTNRKGQNYDSIRHPLMHFRIYSRLLLGDVTKEEANQLEEKIQRIIDTLLDIQIKLKEIK